LLDQLADSGRLVIPVGNREVQQLQRIRKHHNVIETEQLMSCVFVPLIVRRGIIQVNKTATPPARNSLLARASALPRRVLAARRCAAGRGGIKGSVNAIMI